MKSVAMCRRALLSLAALALAAMAIHIGADVASLYLFDAPLDGTIAIVRYYYMVAIIMLPLAAVAAAGEHVVVEVFTQRLTAGVRRGLDLFAGLVTLVYVVVLGWAALLGAWDAYHAGEYQSLYLFDLPIWPMRWVFFLGVAGMAVVVSGVVIGLVLAILNKRESS